MSDHSDNEEIPPAPVFCQRYAPDDAAKLVKQTTADQLLSLGASIQANINASKEKNRQENLRKLDQTVKLSDMLTEYFELDQTGQKARMLELFTKIEKQELQIKELKDSVDYLQKEYKEEKENREEYSDQCDEYIKEIEELERSNKDLEINIVQLRLKSQKEITYYQNRYWVCLGIFALYMSYTLNTYLF
jgi:predicted RNase H-like nuclease (RuvC/YqgF family)